MRSPHLSPHRDAVGPGNELSVLEDAENLTPARLATVPNVASYLPD